MLLPLKFMVVSLTYNLIGSMASALFPPPICLTPSSNETTEFKPPEGYTYLHGIGYHKLYTETKMWKDAWLVCREEGGHLAIINSKKEAIAVGRLIGSKKLYQAAIGIHDLWEEGKWETIEGQSLPDAGYNVWTTGEPNNGGGKGIENCGALTKGGRFNDIRCTVRAPYVCEVPIPRGARAAMGVQYNDTQFTEDNESTEILQATTLPTGA